MASSCSRRRSAGDIAFDIEGDPFWEPARGLHFLLGLLAGELLEYHRREARPAWWWFFERRDQMSLDDLVDDAESIGKVVCQGASRRSPVDHPVPL